MLEELIDNIKQSKLILYLATLIPIAQNLSVLLECLIAGNLLGNHIQNKINIGTDVFKVSVTN